MSPQSFNMGHPIYSIGVIHSLGAILFIHLGSSIYSPGLSYSFNWGHPFIHWGYPIHTIGVIHSFTGAILFIQLGSSIYSQGLSYSFNWGHPFIYWGYPIHSIGVIHSFAGAILFIQQETWHSFNKYYSFSFNKVPSNHSTRIIPFIQQGASLSFNKDHPFHSKRIIPFVQTRIHSFNKEHPFHSTRIIPFIQQGWSLSFNKVHPIHSTKFIHLFGRGLTNWARFEVWRSKRDNILDSLTSAVESSFR